MGSNKKHKTKKHKSHSKEAREEADGAGAGKVKLVFRVPPPHPPSPRPQMSSLLVSLSLKDIARGRQYQSEEGESPSTKHHKKHKKKHHHHKSQSIATPTTSYNSASDEDNIVERKERKGRHYGSGKDFSFHKLPGKEQVFQRMRSGPCLDEDNEGAELTDQEEMETNEVFSKPKREKRDITLPVEINLDVLSIGSSKRPRGSGGKDMRLMKIPKVTSIKKDTPPLPLPQTTPIGSPSLISTKTDYSSQSDDGEKKKKKKKKKHKHYHESPGKVFKTKEKLKKKRAELPDPPLTPNSTNESIEELPIITPPAHYQVDGANRHNDTVTHDHQQESTPKQTAADSPTDSPTVPTHSGVKLPRSALKYFLKHLHSQIQRNDPEGVFAEPVTDDIAPGYSSIIKQSMDLLTIGNKIDNNTYSTVDEFKDDFMLMCTNAMTYNTPETQYYQFSKQLLNFGLKLIQKELSMRPDIRHGFIPSTVASPQPSPSVPPPPSQPTIDYSSPFLCKLDLSSLKPAKSEVGGANDENAIIDVSGEVIEEMVDQSHLTQVQVGFSNGEEKDVPVLSMFPGDEEMEVEEEEVLTRVDHAHIDLKENMAAVTPPPELSYLSEDIDGKTILNVLNPFSVSSTPVNLNTLAEKVKAGENAATVLGTELPVFKATPVSYLMYGPFGSFAPTYDTSFANLTKNDSSLLLTSYGNELGVNYANSLQQFVKGCGNFAMEMADAILNSLTNGRHMKFVESLKKDNDKNTSDGKTVEKGKSGEKGNEKQALMTETAKKMEERTENDGNDGNEKGEKNEEVRERERSESVSIEKEENMEEETVEKDENEKNEALNSLPTPESQFLPEEGLSDASRLLLKLDSEQQERLACPPQISSQGDYLLPSPTETELATASDVSSKLVSLTAKVNPSDVVSVPALHNAMGDSPSLPKSSTS